MLSGGPGAGAADASSSSSGLRPSRVGCLRRAGRGAQALSRRLHPPLPSHTHLLLKKRSSWENQHPRGSGGFAFHSRTESPGPSRHSGSNIRGSSAKLPAPSSPHPLPVQSFVTSTGTEERCQLGGCSDAACSQRCPVSAG